MIIIKNNFDIKKISYIHVGGVVKQYIEFDDYHVLKNIDKFDRNIKFFLIFGNKKSNHFELNPKSWTVYK